MAVTVSADNYNLLSTCDATSNGGTWSGGNALTTETDFYKYSSACLAYTIRQVSTYQLNFAPTASLDLSGAGNSTIVRLWFLSYQQFATQASNGIRFYITDGSNTAYWNVLGGDTYPGGWYMIVVDVSTTPTSGTKPTMTAVTDLGLDITTIGTTKNAPTAFIDHLHSMDGLIAYGDNGTGVPFGVSDIYDADNTTTTAWGAVKPVNTVWFLNTSITIGDGVGSNVTTYEDADELLVYDGSAVADFTFSAVENTGATTFDSSGCTFKASVEPFVFDLSDSAVPATIAGNSFINSGVVTFSSGQTIEQSTFVNCTSITHGTSTFEDNSVTTSGLMTVSATGTCTGNTFNLSTSTASILCADLSHAPDNNFISDGSNHAIELSSIGSGSMTWSGVTSGYTSGGSGGSPVTPTSTGNETIYVNVATSSDLTINVADGATVPSIRVGASFTGDVNVVAGSVTVRVEVEDALSGGVISTARVVLLKKSDHSVVMNQECGVDGFTTVSLTYSSDIDVIGWVRESNLSGTDYVQQDIAGTITSSGLTIAVKLQPN